MRLGLENKQTSRQADRQTGKEGSIAYHVLFFVTSSPALGSGSRSGSRDVAQQG